MHTTNQRAFRDCDSTEPFFRLYTTLVATELALKNQLPAFEQGHDLSTLILKLLSTLPAALQAQIIALETALQSLICTHNGVRAPVKAVKYPAIRYLRLEKDGFAGDTTDEQVILALTAAQRLVQELGKMKVVV